VRSGGSDVIKRGWRLGKGIYSNADRKGAITNSHVGGWSSAPPYLLFRPTSDSIKRGYQL